MNFPLIEAVIWSLIVVLIFIIAILVLYLKILRRNIRIVERRNTQYRKMIEELLVEFLYAEPSEDNKFTENQQRIIKKFKKGLVSKRKRKIITETFLQLDQQVSGQMIVVMNRLYKEIGLLNFALRKLRSRKWYIVGIGIKDLRQFKVRRAKHAVAKLVNHHREEVRREAHLYFLELFGYEGLQFLNDLKVPLSDWDQVLLLGEVENLENHEIKDVSKWLTSKNDYVILFVLNIVKVFNRLETKNELLNLLQHKNEEVRIKTIEVLTHFEVVEAKEILKNNYEKLSIKEKIVFYQLFEKTATAEDDLFLVEQITENDFELKYKALKILSEVNINLYNKLEKESEDESYNKIIQFLDYSYGN